MAHDNDGNLHPYMLSELIADAQKALAEHGDLPVWSVTQYHGYDDTYRASEPVGYPPIVGVPRGVENYWGHPKSSDKHAKAFIVSGSGTG